MQPNKITTALGLGVLCLGVSGTSIAATGTFPITAATIADVGLVQNDPISFGTNIFTTAGTCVLIGDQPTDVELQIVPTIANTALINGINNGNLSGTGCVGGDGLGTPGKFTVTGISGAAVTVSMGSIPDTDNGGEWSFTPNRSVAGLYDNNSTDSADVRQAVSSSAPTSLFLAGAIDALGIGVTDSALVITLGGTLNVLQTLTANQAYSGSFDLTVTY
jgi:hypothetical protein